MKAESTEPQVSAEGTGSADPTAGEADPRTNFIPLRHTVLRAKLAESLKLDARQVASFDRVCKHLKAIFHVEHLSVMLELEDLYSNLDPDSELLDLEATCGADRKRMSQTLIDQITDLLASAHYQKLSREELEVAIELGCQGGVRLDVDFEMFDQLEIFARGYQTVEVTQRRWQNFYRAEKIELAEFQRLIMLFRIRPESQPAAARKFGRKPKNPFDENFVYLKTFKNIPKSELEILLPGSRVRLTRLDQAKILLPTLSGTFITAYKIFRSAVVLSLAITIGAILGWIFFAAAIIGYVAKSVMNYFRTKNKYQFDLTKSLYLKNLDNNLSVIYRILNEAEEQELCETILAYTLLWRHPAFSVGGATREELDQVAETFLNGVTEMDVDFEVDGALDKLDRLGMARVGRDGRWKALAVPDTMNALRENWTGLFQAKTDLADEP